MSVGISAAGILADVSSGTSGIIPGAQTVEVPTGTEVSPGTRAAEIPMETLESFPEARLADVSVGTSKTHPEAQDD